MLTTLALVATLVAAASSADSVTGRWQLKGDVAGSPLNTVCDIKQSGAALTGSCTNETGEASPITGEVKDGAVTFKHAGDYQGTALTITYSGKLESPKQLKGTIEVAPFSVSGSFTAEPAPAKS
jgi:hypothetical protein